MFSHLNRLLKQSVVYGMSETISRGTGFVLMFYYLRVLSTGDIGVRRLIYSAVAFVILFYTLGIDQAFLRYFMDRKYADRKKEIFSTATAFTFFFGLLVLSIASLFSGPVSRLLTGSSDYGLNVILVGIIMIFDTMVIYPALVMRAEGRVWYFSSISLTRFVLLISLNFIIVSGMGHGLLGVFEANLITMFLIFLMVLPIYKEYFRLTISPALLYLLLTFGVPTIFTVFFVQVINFADNYMLKYFFGDNGTVVVGMYASAYTLGMVGINTFLNSFRLAWHPFFLSLRENPDAQNIFARITTYYAVFIGYVFLGMTLLREEIFRIYAPSMPISLAGIIPVVALAYILYGFYIIMMAGVFLRDKTKLLPLAPVLGAVVNIGANIVVIPLYGIVGAAFSTVLSYMVMVVIIYIISRRYYSIPFEYGRLVAVIALTVGCIAMTYFYGNIHWLPRLGITSVLLAVPPVVYWWSGFMHETEKEKIRELVLRLKVYGRSGLFSRGA